MVERSISLVAGHDGGGAAVPRHQQNNAWLHHRVAALNLRRLLALGLARSDGSWALAT